MLLAIKIVIVAYVYEQKLLNEGMILNWWYKFVHKHVKNEFWRSPLTDCIFCITGQMMLWTYLYQLSGLSILDEVGNLIFYISLAIFTQILLKKWL